MSGRRSRNKGAGGERELVILLKELGLDARRTAQRRGNYGDADVEVKQWPDCHIEVKRVEALNIDNAMAQAMNDASAEKIPLVIHRRNGKIWKVTLPLNRFVELMHESQSQKTEARRDNKPS